MKWVLRKTARALDDLADIWDYIAVDNQSAADKLVRDLLTLFDKTAGHPMIGRSVDEIARNHRMLSHGRYLLIYCVYEDKQTVELVRVIHAAREWPKLFEN